MRKCPNCGAELSDEVSFCSGCGQAVKETPVEATVIDSDTDVQSNRGIAWLAYCGPLLLIPMLARKTSEYCKFHVKQGATLLAVCIAYQTVTEILKAILRGIFPAHIRTVLLVSYYEESVPVKVFSAVFALGSIFITVLAIIGIVNAAKGNKNKLPVVGAIPWIEMLMDKIYASMNK